MCEVYVSLVVDQAAPVTVGDNLLINLTMVNYVHDRLVSMNKRVHWDNVVTNTCQAILLVTLAPLLNEDAD